MGRATLEWFVPLLETWWVTLTVLAGLLGAVAAVIGLAFWWCGAILKELKQVDDLRERQSLQLRIEELKKQNLELEQRLVDRALTDAQVENIAERVKLFAGQEYWIVTYWDLSGPLSLARRIYASLT